MSWHSIKDAAPLLNLSPTLVYRLCGDGRLAHRRLGRNPGRGKIQISDEAIAVYLKSCEVRAKEPAAATPGRKPDPAPRSSGRLDGRPIRSDWFS